MLGKNILWCARQHGHSVQVMLTMYGAWIEGSTAEDIAAIKGAWKPAQPPRKSTAQRAPKVPRMPSQVPLKCRQQGPGAT